MRLVEYVAQCGETQTAVAARFGISVSHLNEMLATETNPGRARKRRASPELAARIFARTGGLISIEELLFPAGLPTHESAILDATSTCEACREPPESDHKSAVGE